MQKAAGAIRRPMVNGQWLQGDVNPCSFVDELRVRQMVADVRQPTGVHRDVNSSTLGVVTVRCTTHGFVERLTAEAAVDVYRLVEVVSQGLQHLGAQTHEVVDFDRVNAVFNVLLLSGLAAEHFFLAS